MSNLKSNFEKLSDLELRDVVTLKSDEYTEEAIKFANEVLEERGLSDFSEIKINNPTQIETVNDCIQSSDFEIVREKLAKLFLENEENLEEYKKVYTNLLKMTPVDSEEEVSAFIGQTGDNFTYKYPFDVFGIESTSTDYFGLELYPWNEWLAFKLLDNTKSFLETAGVNEFVAICLHKMTALGFSEEEIQNSFNDNFDNEDFEDFE